MTSKKDTVRALFAAAERGDAAGVYACHHPDGMRDHRLAPGPEALRKHIDDTFALFASCSGVRFEVLEMVEEGDLVATRWRFSCHHDPSGTDFTSQGMSFERFRDGLIAERWELFVPTVSDDQAGPEGGRAW